MTRSALVTGASGQDGWYLAESLVAEGFRVIGTTHRRDAPDSLSLPSGEVPLLYLDLGDSARIDEVIQSGQFDHVYNLAGRTSSLELFDRPTEISDVNGLGVVRLLDAIHRHSPDTRFCQASSSEVFAGVDTSPQDENTPRRSTSMYGAAKVFADQAVAAYRASRGLYACSAILFSHESPRRAPHYVFRKVTAGAARIACGMDEVLTIGDLDAVRDWGFAGDYVGAMRAMLEADTPLDLVVATGVAHTVRDLCVQAFDLVGLHWEDHVRVDATYQRLRDRAPRVGDPTLAQHHLGWSATMTFSQLVEYLVDTEMRSCEGRH